MGVTASYASFLLDAVSGGLRLGRTLTLGRLTLYVDPSLLEQLIVRAGVWPVGMTREVFLERIARSPYVEEFLGVIGATSVESMDASSYEHATIVHDLDQPVPSSLHGQFDCVLDGGTLEHVFDFPTAIRSCMAMTRVGGHLILSLPANNCLGHGFYQFSPELVYRTLSCANGFEVLCMEAVETNLVFGAVLGVPLREELAGPRYVVPDPATLGKRMELCSRTATVLMVIARRVRSADIFGTTPKQSDYVSAWEVAADAPTRADGQGPGEGGVGGWKGVRRMLKAALPLGFRRACVSPFKRVLAQRTLARLQQAQSLPRALSTRRR